MCRGLNQHFKLLHIHIAMWLILKKSMLAFGLHIGHKERTNVFSLDRIFDEYIKSEALH